MKKTLFLLRPLAFQVGVYLLIDQTDLELDPEETILLGGAIITFFRYRIFFSRR